MLTLRATLLRLRVWLVCSAFRAQRFFKSLIGASPYYTKFPPDRRFSIQSSCSTRSINISMYLPDEFDKTKNYPVHINFHGSAFILPMFGSDSDFCRSMSSRTGAIVLDSDYAKAPKWPFPAAPEDVKDVIDHVVANAEGYYDPSRISIGGFSAGGTLAMTALASQPKGTLKGIIAMYPAADLSIDHSTRLPPVFSEGNTNPVPAPLIKLAYDSYMPLGTDFSDPRLSPVNVPISSFPEHVLIIVCEEDPVRDEAVELAKKLKTAGVKVVLKEMPKTVHGWDKELKEGVSRGWATRNEAYDAAADMLKLVFRT